LWLLFFPMWPNFQDGSFVLEPARQASVHASVEGQVVQVLVDEGQRVVAGQPLVNLENLDLQSDLARARADLHVASARATQSQMRYGDFGTAERERQSLLQEDHSLTEKAAKLQLVSPIAGVVVTPRLHDLTGSYLDEGAPVIELIDDSALRARIYIPEFAMRDVHVGTPVRLQVRSRFLPISAILGPISADWVPLDKALGEKEQLEGINPPRFYVAEAWLNSAAGLRPGMTGIVKFRVGTNSMAVLSYRFVRDLITRRVW
jgi:multidrug resistance efflux pump